MSHDSSWATAALRIHSSTLDARKIAEVLQTEPTSFAVMGERLSPNNPRSAVCASHLWVLDSNLKSAQLEEHIRHLAEFVEQHLPALKAISQSCEIDVFCGFSSESGQGTITIDANLIQRLSILPLDLVFDLYPA